MRKVGRWIVLCWALAAAAEVPGWASYQRGDFAAARRQFEQAAEAGDRVAAFDMAMMDWRGEGATADRARALRWLRRAAELRSPQAQHALGVLYETGQGVDKSLTEATRWFRQAADQGYLPAELDLGTQYFLGRGAARITGWRRSGTKSRAAGRCRRAVFDRQHVRAWRRRGTGPAGGDTLVRQGGGAGRCRRQAQGAGSGQASQMRSGVQARAGPRRISARHWQAACQSCTPRRPRTMMPARVSLQASGPNCISISCKAKCSEALCCSNSPTCS